MSKIQKHNISNIKRCFERSTGVRLVKYMQQSERETAHRNIKNRKLFLVTAIVSLSLLLVAFTWNIFSPRDGDALTLDAVYEGNGIVKITVENHSHKQLEFQPQTKLFKWITDEEVPMLTDAIEYDNLSIDPNSVEILTLDLSNAYDLTLLESSLATEWYYLILTNQNFADGQTWKCSVHFGAEQLGSEKTDEPRYQIEEAILSNIDEELRFYFEDDYYDIFAGNPLHYKYLQKVQEMMQRTRKNVVGSVDTLLYLEPIKDGVVLDENSDLERPYQLRSTWPTVHDEFGKLVGFMDDQHVRKITVNTEDGWLFPIMYLATYWKEEITENSCTFIYGQIVDFKDLAPYLVYENETYCMYDVTHLFYTDLRAYFEEVVNMDPDYYENAERYWDRIQNVYTYTKEHLTFYTPEEWREIYPHVSVEDHVYYKEMWKEGIYGILTCNFDMERIVANIYAEDGTTVYTKTIIPEDPHRHDLSKETEVSEALKSLSDGRYTVEIYVYIKDTEFMSCISAWGSVIYAGPEYYRDIETSNNE